MRRASQIAKDSARFRAELLDLGAQVRKLRLSRKWTLEKAAEASDIDLKHWQKIESGVVNVTMVTLVRIAEGFAIPMSALFRPVRKR